MPFCTSCGSSVSAAAKFCTSCGTKVPATAPASVASTTSTRPASVSASSKNVSSSSSSSSTPDYGSVIKSSTNFCTQCGDPMPGKTCLKCNAGSNNQASASSTSPRRSTLDYSSSTVVGGGGGAGQQKKCVACGNVGTSKFCTICGDKMVEMPLGSTSSRNSVATSYKINSSAPVSPAKRDSSPPKNTSAKASFRKSVDVTSAPKPAPSSSGGSSRTLSTTKPASSVELTCAKCGTAKQTKFCTQCGHKDGEPLASPSSASSSSNNSSSSSTTSSASVSSSNNNNSSSSSSSTSAAQPKCAKCGVSKDTKFCTQCGHRDGEPIAPPSQARPANTEKRPPPPKSKQPAPQAGAGAAAAAGKPPPPTGPPPPPPSKPKPPVPNTSSSSIQQKKAPPPPSTPKPPVPADPGLQRLAEENERLKKQLVELEKLHRMSLPQQMATPPSGVTPPPGPSTSAATASTATTTTSQPNSSSSNDSSQDDGAATDEAGGGRRRTWRQKYDTIKNSRSFIQAKEASANSAASAAAGGGNSTNATTSAVSGDSTTPSAPQSKAPTRTRAYTDTNLGPRDKVIWEIIETEEDYVHDLETIVNIFISGISKEELATRDEITGIFSNLELILELNKLLFKELSGKDGKNVGAVFTKHADYLKLYTTYCTNQQTSFAIINKLKEKKDKKFDTFLYYCLARPECNGLDFSAYMIKPVQRICKYPLLLKELIKQTEETHTEYSELKDAYAKIEDIVVSINEKKRDMENIQRVYEISKLIDKSIDIIAPTRRFNKEGELQHYDSKMKLKEGYYFLFNDSFLYTKKKGNKYLVKTFCPFDKAQIRYVATYEKPTFELVSTDKAWPLVFPSDEEKMKFMEELQDLIDKSVGADSAFSRRSASVSAVDVISFECQYYDSRTVRFPRNPVLAYNVFYWGIANEFGVNALTIMSGDRFIMSQEELDSLLTDKKATYQLSIYDYYETSSDDQSYHQT